MTSLGFVVLVAIWMGVAALALDFEPLFALAYAISYGSFIFAALVVVILTLWVLIAGGKSTITAIRDWEGARDAHSSLRILVLAACTVVAAFITVELVLIAVATGL